ncbi:hypothetical protein [[Mycoplasma] gypis]|uniref:Variable surface lipoprotein n=1 Tax=[Mycoplasma] gypis TaxID=92404 RepID=A0ABZ2RV21_9BACT|nr:hypothetical protein [[Mycoplasma] gypis]MBN0919441.1 hypothetical protein [[Mycoplasma] gypis]
MKKESNKTNKKQNKKIFLTLLLSSLAVVTVATPTISASCGTPFKKLRGKINGKIQDIKNKVHKNNETNPQPAQPQPETQPKQK